MSAQNKHRRLTVQDIRNRKQDSSGAIVCLTAYTAPMARLMDEHVDLILVGDSLGMVVYGMDSTVPVTLDMMIAHGQAVMRGSSTAMVVVDMPFGSYQESPEQAFHNASRVMKEVGCAAVKLEGGEELADTIAFLTRRGIPVLGHIGLKPQSVHATGGYKIMGGALGEAEQIIKDARAVEQAGAFALVLECVYADFAERLVPLLSIPTIGIGASGRCEGQILVLEDMLGLSGARLPRFVKPYATLHEQVTKAIVAYADDVRGGVFPGSDYVYGSPSVLDDKGHKKRA